MVDLLRNSLTQWTTHVQDVTSSMILPPEVVVNCPQVDIVGVLNRLEGMTWVRYCRLCFGFSQKYRCSGIPNQAPNQASALWTPPTMSYVAMASSTKTTASSSAAGVPPPRYPPPGLPLLEPMDTLLTPTSENLLATAGVGRGSRGQRQPSTSTAPGLCQTRPVAPQQWTPAPRRQEANQVTPYRQQLYLPQCPTGVQTTTPSKAPPLGPVRVAVRWLGKGKVPEVGPPPKGLKANTGKTDPPPEDLGNADEVSRVTTLWTRRLTTWPQDGNETSRT